MRIAGILGLFWSSIDSERTFALVLKLNCLNGLLVGQAKGTEAGLDATSTNYIETLKLLREVYKEKASSITSTH